MTIEQAKKKVLDLAKSQIGYHETGENLTKYASAYDFDNRLYGFDMSGQPWCDYFVDWLFCETFGYDLGCKMTFQFSGCAGASCAMSAEYYADAGSFYSTMRTTRTACSGRRTKTPGRTRKMRAENDPRYLQRHDRLYGPFHGHETDMAPNVRRGLRGRAGKHEHLH